MKMVPKYIVDASVVMAFANDEPMNYTQGEMRDLLQDSVITTYNLAEAVSKMVINLGSDEEKMWAAFCDFIKNRYPIDDELSLAAVKMAKLTKPFGLSLGDRYCIALGKLLDLPVYTADKIWKTLEDVLGVTIVLIR